MFHHGLDEMEKQNSVIIYPIFSNPYETLRDFHVYKLNIQKVIRKVVFDLLKGYKCTAGKF